MKKKDMNFLQAFNTSDISLLGDADKDKVPNVFDCKPFDKDRDGLFGRAINVATLGKYGQTREEYGSEKTTKTHFERDERGKVTITRNGQEVIPWKPSEQLLREHRKSQAEEALKAKLENQKRMNESIRKQIESKKLQIEKQKLLAKQKTQALSHSQPSLAQDAFSLIFGMPRQRPRPIAQLAPTEPPKKQKVKKTHKPPNVCPFCNTPMILVPTFLGQPMWQCPRCVML